METRKPDIHVPREIWENKELTMAERCIFAQVHYLDNPKTHCYASNEYFAEYFQVSERTVSRAITHLIELGYISQISFNGRSRVLKSNIVTVLESETGFKKIVSIEDTQDGEADQTKCLPSTEKISMETRQNVYSPLKKCLSKEYIKNKDNINKNKDKYNININKDTIIDNNKESILPLNHDEDVFSKKPNKVDKKQQCLDMIESQIENETLQEVLKDYFPIWYDAVISDPVKARKINIVNNWKGNVISKLNKGLVEAIDDKPCSVDEQIQAVNNAMRGGITGPYTAVFRPKTYQKFSQPKSNNSQQIVKPEKEEYLDIGY